MHQNRVCPCLLQLSALKQADQQKQHHRADNSHHELPDQSVGGKPQQAEYPTAEERTDNSHDQVNQDTHAVAFHDLSGEEADEDTDQNFPKQPHSLPPKASEWTKGAFQLWVRTPNCAQL